MDLMRSWIAHPPKKKRIIPALLCLVALSVIGFADYIVGFHISLIVFYILPIGFATLYVGPLFASVLAFLSVVIWMGGDLLAGAPYPGVGIQLWNGAIVLSLFGIVVYLLSALRMALVGLESTVEERTEALRLEMEERERLECEILDLTERERQIFGQELHDTVCQELAGAAIAGQMLTKRLQARNLEEAKAANVVTEMISSSLNKARDVARRFFTAGFDALGLADALRELVVHAEQQSGIHCEFKWEENLPILDEEVVVQLFRIAQEAIRNVLKHSGATQLKVNLDQKDETLRIVIEDNGKGLAGSANGKGLGLRIMVYRAEKIGGRLEIISPSCDGVGTQILCQIATKKLTKQSSLPG